MLARAFIHGRAHLNMRNDQPINARASVDELRAALGHPLPQVGMPAAQIIDELVRDVAGGLYSMSTGRFFGWVNGGALRYTCRGSVGSVKTDTGL